MRDNLSDEEIARLTEEVKRATENLPPEELEVFLKNHVKKAGIPDHEYLQMKVLTTAYEEATDESKRAYFAGEPPILMPGAENQVVWSFAEFITEENKDNIARTSARTSADIETIFRTAFMMGLDVGARYTIQSKA